MDQFELRSQDNLSDEPNQGHRESKQNRRGIPCEDESTEISAKAYTHRSNFTAGRNITLVRLDAVLSFFEDP